MVIYRLYNGVEKMKIVELIQNTPEWLEWRKGGIGASDTNIIMGKSKFMTPVEFLEIQQGKRERKPVSEFITGKGHRLEDKMREYYELLLDLNLKKVCGESEKHDGLFASFDGYDESVNCPWEHKLVGKDDFEIVENGSVLEQYKYQLQHQMLVCESDVLIFAVAKEVPKSEAIDEQWPYETCHIVVESSPELQAEILAAHENFKLAKIGKAELGLTKNDIVDMSSNNQLVELVAEYQTIKQMEKRKKEIENIFRKAAAKHKIIVEGVKISVGEPSERETVDFKSFIEENMIEIPNHYKKTTKQKGRLTVK